MRIGLLRLTRVIWVVLALVAPLSGPPPTDAAGPLVLAFYYAWYDQNTWTSGQLSDLPPQPYVSADPATIDHHVRQAQSAGIDGFVQSWYGPGGGNQTETNFATLLNTAAAYGFWAAADFEVASPYFSTPADRVAALRHLLSVHAAHPAYLRVDGRPVVFFWAPQLLSVDQWADVRAEVDPHRESIWIVEGAALDYLPIFDGLHLYNIAWSDNPAATLTNWGGQVRAKADALGAHRYWVATAMPGWDDSQIAGRTGAFVRDRAGGDYYRRTWAGAIASAPDLVIVTSFNEWMEGSMIEPSASYGDLYLGLTGELVAAYKAGVVPALNTAAQDSPTAPPTAGAETATAQVEPTLATPSDPAEPESVTPTEPGPRPDWPTPRPDGTIVHVVESGDTLLGIANRYGVDLEELLVLNDLERTAILTIGQPVIVAVVTPTPVPTPTPTATPTRAPAIRAANTPLPTRRPTEADPTRAATATLNRPAVVTPQATPTPALTPTGERSAPDGQVLLPWPAITLGLLLVVAVWLLFRNPPGD